MINHDVYPNCDWNVESGVEIISQTDIEKGDELFIAYGNHGNDLLVQYYGFTLEHQPVSLFSSRRNFAKTDKGIVKNLDFRWY